MLEPVASSDTPNVMLWCSPQVVDEPDLMRRYHLLLTDAERDRYQRLRREEDRQRFLQARALVRTVLGEYCACDPASLCFQAGVWGKPELKSGQTAVPYFNLSHTRGMVVLAVSWQCAVGIDVEPVQRELDVMGLTERYFAAEELAALRRLPVDQRQAWFVKLWTLKEAYVKALGVGLRIPLDSFVFDMTGAAITCEHRDDAADAVPMQFRSLLPEPGYRVALAVATSQPLDVHCMRGVPLRGFERLVP